MEISTEEIENQFGTINDLSKKALLATNNQTFAKRKIKSLTLKLLSKFKKKGLSDKKSKRTMLGQMILRSRMGSKIFDYADLMPFGETAVTLDKWHESDKDFINASYIKTSFGEDHPTDDNEPFGLMIATSGPHKNVEEFWKMIIQQNATRVVSLCETMGNQTESFYKEAS